MTVNQMHTLFKIFLDKSTQTNAGFEPEEIDLFLNLAVKRKIKTIMDRKLSQTFEEVDYKTKDLSTLITPYSTTTFTQPSGIWGYFVRLPLDFYRYVLWESCKISGNDCHDIVVEKTLNDCIVVPHNSYQDFIQNPFTRPDENTYLRATISMEDPFTNIVHYGHDLVVATGYTPVEYKMRYIRVPATISISSPAVDCDLPEFTHEEIVREAVELAVASILQVDMNVTQNQINRQE